MSTVNQTTKNSPITSSITNQSQLIKKCSLFDTNNSKVLIDSIVDVVDLIGLSVVTVDEDISPLSQAPSKPEQAAVDSIQNLSLTDKITCTTCLCSFIDREEQIEHYKGDLHLFNIKQKLKGKPIVNAEEFEKLTDISSISGSDTENDDFQYNSSDSSESDLTEDEDEPNNLKGNKNKPNKIQNRPKVFFKLNDSNVLSMFRCVLYAKRNAPENKNDLISLVRSIKPDDRWCVILVAAGHFAAAVFKGDQVIVHKTFHRYVVRAKRGGVQSQHDSSGKHAKSAGANIRRSQEAHFKDEIKTLIGTDWKSEIDKCQCVFIRVPHYNRGVLISSNNDTRSGSANTTPFSKNDPRLRNIPFMTFRPTFNEVKRIHNLLSRIDQFNESYLDTVSKLEKKTNETPEKTLNKSTESKDEKNKKQKSKKKSKSNQNSNELSREEDLDLSLKLVDNKKTENSDSEIETTKEPVITNDDFIQSLSGDNLKLFNDLYTSCATNNAAKLRQIFSERVCSNVDKTHSENQSFLIEKLINKRLNRQTGFTLLHLTSQLGNGECVWELLLNGANPAISDLTKQKVLPYFISANKSIRDQYRRFMNDYPNRYDYVAAKITEPLSAEKMNEKLEKEKEKKKQKRMAKKEKEAQMKQKEQLIEIEENEKRLFLSLTDQEKRMLVVDRNFLNIMPTNDKNDLENISQVKYSAEKIRIISRCWYCATDMSSSVPFEYFDYKFCSTKCLKSHRTQQQDLKQKPTLTGTKK